MELEARVLPARGPRSPVLPAAFGSGNCIVFSTTVPGNWPFADLDQAYGPPSLSRHSPRLYPVHTLKVHYQPKTPPARERWPALDHSINGEAHGPILCGSRPKCVVLHSAPAT